MLLRMVQLNVYWDHAQVQPFYYVLNQLLNLCYSLAKLAALGRWVPKDVEMERTDTSIALGKCERTKPRPRPPRRPVAVTRAP